MKFKKFFFFLCIRKYFSENFQFGNYEKAYKMAVNNRIKEYMSEDGKLLSLKIDLNDYEIESHKISIITQSEKRSSGNSTRYLDILASKNKSFSYELPDYIKKEEMPDVWYSSTKTNDMLTVIFSKNYASSTRQNNKYKEIFEHFSDTGELVKLTVDLNGFEVDEFETAIDTIIEKKLTGIAHNRLSIKAIKKDHFKYNLPAYLELENMKVVTLPDGFLAVDFADTDFSFNNEINNKITELFSNDGKLVKIKIDLSGYEPRSHDISLHNQIENDLNSRRLEISALKKELFVYNLPPEIELNKIIMIRTNEFLAFEFSNSINLFLHQTSKENEKIEEYFSSNGTLTKIQIDLTNYEPILHEISYNTIGERHQLIIKVFKVDHFWYTLQSDVECEEIVDYLENENILVIEFSVQNNHSLNNEIQAHYSSDNQKLTKLTCDLSKYNPCDINIKVIDKKMLEIRVSTENKEEKVYSYEIPDYIQLDKIKATFLLNGVLSVNFDNA